jgi:hypothetical protein
MGQVYKSGTQKRVNDRQQFEADFQFASMTLEAMRELARRRQLVTGQSYLLNKAESEIAAQLEAQRDHAYQLMNKEPN